MEGWKSAIEGLEEEEKFRVIKFKASKIFIIFQDEKKRLKSPKNIRDPFEWVCIPFYIFPHFFSCNSCIIFSKIYSVSLAIVIRRTGANPKSAFWYPSERTALRKYRIWLSVESPKVEQLIMASPIRYFAPSRPLSVSLPLWKLFCNRIGIVRTHLPSYRIRSVVGPMKQYATNYVFLHCFQQKFMFFFPQENRNKPQRFHSVGVVLMWELLGEIACGGLCHNI